MITYNNLYLELRKKLKEADLPGAALEARELLCLGSGKTREEFYRDAPLYVSPETEKAVRALARRRLDGEPAAYLLGEWDFCGLTLDVSPAVLIPRVDTEVLAEEAIHAALWDYAKKRGIVIEGLKEPVADIDEIGEG